MNGKELKQTGTNEWLERIGWSVFGRSATNDHWIPLGDEPTTVSNDKNKRPVRLLKAWRPSVYLSEKDAKDVIRATRRYRPQWWHEYRIREAFALIDYDPDGKKVEP